MNLDTHTRREFLRSAGKLAIGGYAFSSLARQVPRPPVARRPKRVAVIGAGHYHATLAPFYLRILQNEKLDIVGVHVTKLPIWTLNGGSRGGDGFRLQDFEFDGFVNISDATDSIHLPWHILPHRSASVTPASSSVSLSGGTGSLSLSNAGGAVAGGVDVFSLLGTSGRIPPPRLPDPGGNFAVIDLKSVGARIVSLGGGQFGMQFAINTFGVRSHPNYPAEFDIFIDTNRDGVDDYVVFNTENGGFAATGQNVVAAGP
jgi:hypothetical protein